MSDLINHSEAFELAQYQKTNSNVARCYLDHCKTLESLTRELAAVKVVIEGLRKDALRFRYLQNHKSFQSDKGRYVWYLPRSFTGRGYLSLEETIDAAIAEK